MSREFTARIEWPNGQGFTPCTQAAHDVAVALDRLTDGGRVSMHDMSPADYERFNRLSDEQAHLQADGHYGKSVRYEDDASDPFAGLDDLDTEAPTAAPAEPQPGVDFEDDQPPAREWVEMCPKCRGTGNFWGPSRHGRRCFACKGAGKFTYRTSPEDRAKGRASRERAKVNEAARLAAEAQAWREANPEDAAWLQAKRGRFDFATAMFDALAKYGHLTERQHATVTRLRVQDAERDATRAAEAEARAASAPEVTVAKIEEAFAEAKANGIKAPKLRLDTFRFSPAPAHSKNAGAIYVKEGDDYLGKIVGGRFLRVRTCEEVTAERVVAAASDPKAAAVAYGARTGSCSCCGRELTNQASIDLGIGPICAGKYGW